MSREGVELGLDDGDHDDKVMKKAHVPCIIDLKRV